jgi:ubiquinone/menaquinone biosynthesis C-methylase UbiE
MPNYFNDDFSKLQHEGWSRVAELYQDSWARVTRQFIAPLLQPIKFKPGMKVLDVACGPGYVSKAIQEKNATAIGVDFSAAMINLARKNFPDIEFVEGDAQKLDFPDAGFDAVVMNFGMVHLSKPETAIAEAWRVLKKDGTYAFTLQGPPEKNPAGKIMNESIMKFADTSLKVPQPPEGNVFSDQSLTKELLLKNGFSTIQFQDHYVEWEVPTADYFFDKELNAGVRTAAFLKLQTPETLAKIKAEVANRMKEVYNGKNYTLKFCATVVSAKK